MSVALITGAGSGIGRATALELGRRGYRLALCDRNGETAGETAELADNALAVHMDVADFNSVQRGVREALAWGGQIGLLVNGAGIGSTQTVVNTPPELWEDVFAVNVRDIFNTARAVLPGMIERGRGVIVNVASVAGLVGLPNRAAYCASKGAVISLTKAMAVDHVKQGIRVNCVCPGTVDSPWVGRLLDEEDVPAAARAQLVARQPMGRLGRPDEIASAIAYIASGDEADFMTGTALVLDGGLVAQ